MTKFLCFLKRKNTKQHEVVLIVHLQQEKCLVITSSLKIARIMCSDAAAQGCATEQHCQAICTKPFSPQATTVCVKLCGLDKSLAAH